MDDRGGARGGTAAAGEGGVIYLEAQKGAVSWFYGPSQRLAFEALATHGVMLAPMRHSGFRGLFEGGLANGEAVGGGRVRYKLTLRGRQFARHGGFAGAAE